MLRRFSLVLVTVLAMGVTNAWAIGISIVGGANIGMPSTDPEVTGLKGGTSLPTAGVLLDVGSRIGFEVGALYSIDSLKYPSQLGEVTLSYKGFMIPALLRIRPVQYISFGVGGYFQTISNVCGELLSVELCSAPSESNTETSAIGALASIALNVPMGKAASLVLDGRYRMGMKDIDKSEDVKLKLSGAQILAGIRFGF